MSTTVSFQRIEKIRFTQTKKKERAIVFIHGFTGRTVATWGKLPGFLSEKLPDWDIFAMGYPTSLLPDLCGIWSADPDVPAIVKNVIARFTQYSTHIKGYEKVAVVAHSLGGLIMQRAILDNEELARKVSHLIMFGTPSRGLYKTKLFSGWKRQIQNVQADGEFIRTLRKDWETRFPTVDHYPFRLWSAAGLQDQFVPEWTAHRCFPDSFCCFVNGDHFNLIKPKSPEDDSVLLVESVLAEKPLTGAEAKQSEIIVVADFDPQSVVAAPASEKKQIIKQALKLERMGHPHLAVDLLRHTFARPADGRFDVDGDHTDLMGSLAGQLKRLWLYESPGDTLESSEGFVLPKVPSLAHPFPEEAFNLYREALLQSFLHQDDAQIFYHAINVAFLAKVYKKDEGLAKKSAATALRHAQRAPRDYWSIATMAEANLYLGDFRKAAAFYKQAIAYPDHPFNMDTTLKQAAFVLGAMRLEIGEWSKFDQLLSPWAEEGDKVHQLLEHGAKIVDHES